MTASELPIGARFTLPGDAIVYTVGLHVIGRFPFSHLTFVSHLNWDGEELHHSAFAGHTEVILIPETITTGSTEAAP